MNYQMQKGMNLNCETVSPDVTPKLDFSDQLNNLLERVDCANQSMCKTLEFINGNKPYVEKAETIESIHDAIDKLANLLAINEDLAYRIEGYLR